MTMTTEQVALVQDSLKLVDEALQVLEKVDNKTVAKMASILTGVLTFAELYLSIHV